MVVGIGRLFVLNIVVANRGCCDDAIADLVEKMTEFLECEKPIVGEFCVDKTEHTLPMVPAGARLHDMVLCKGQQPLTEEEMNLG